MNLRLLSRYLGLLVIANAACLLAPLPWSIYFSERDAAIAFIEAAMVGGAFGAVLFLLGRKAETDFYQREALALVALGWIAAAFVSALPYISSGTLHPVDALFESMSGLTTTGATVITDIEACSKTLLFWRAMTHWLGALGIVVLFIAVLPFLGAATKMIYKTEVTGIDKRGLSPRIRDTARILLNIMLGLTIAQTIALLLAGMNLYEALAHTFSTLGTGGFSTRQASIAGFNSLPIEIICIVFMVLAGTNFGLYFAMAHGQWWAMFRSSEWRLYIGIMVVVTLLITLNLQGVQMYPFEDLVHESHQRFPPKHTWTHSLREAAFQVVSCMTCTGFITADFDDWPHLSRMLLVWVMLIGGSAGSTSGGLKVIRVLLIGRLVLRQIERTFRPYQVRALRVDGEVYDTDSQRNVLTYFAAYCIAMSMNIMVMSLIGLPFESAISAVITCTNNVGPGLEFVGAIRDFSLVPMVGKLYLSFCMLLGRLELYVILVLFLPSFWRVR